MIVYKKYNLTAFIDIEGFENEYRVYVLEGIKILNRRDTIENYSSIISMRGNFL